jgi:hypothetical protein
MSKVSDTSTVLSERAVIAILNIGLWTGRKVENKVSRKAEEDHGTGHGVLHTSKKLLKSETLDAIAKACGAARGTHNKFTSPWGDDGSRLLPTELFFKYSEEMNNHQSHYEELVESFVDDFDSETKDAEKTLGNLYKKEDYPTKKELKNKFYFDIRILEVPHTGDWRVNLPGDEKARLQKQAADYINGKFEAAISDVWDRLYDALFHIHERLSDPTAKFRDTLIGNLDELLEILPALNITGNPELTARATEAKQKICVFKPNVLRIDSKARAEAADAAADLIRRVKSYAPSASAR